VVDATGSGHFRIRFSGGNVMKRIDFGVLAGLILVVAGALLLLQTFSVISFAWGTVWAFVFAAGGLVCLWAFARDREQWWALIPGFVLLGLGALLGLETLAPRLAGTWGGAIFLLGVSAAFWAVYAARREYWWAVIPAGVMLTLALVAGITSSVPGAGGGGLFFLGLGATFGLLYLLPTREGRMKWALIPAIVLLIFGAVLAASEAEVLGFVGPAVLVLAGLYLVLRAARR
jgi:hypothetical protein